MKRVLDNLIGHMRTVVVAGINMVHARVDGLAQNGNGGRDISGRPEDAGSGKLHSAVTHAVQACRCVEQREAAGSTNLFNHFVSPCYNHWMKDSSGLDFAYAG